MVDTLENTAPEVVRVHKRLESHNKRINVSIEQEPMDMPLLAISLVYDISRDPGFRQMFLRRL
jgi:hypothetical protein